VIVNRFFVEAQMFIFFHKNPALIGRFKISSDVRSKLI
jgi:hypothetical protein